jgi:formylglycine-generating enzyme required for sulfatase activity
VAWNDARVFAVWLSKRTGQTYRLLTEAEWEYAARAGSTSRYSFGDKGNELCRHANVGDRSLKKAIPDWKHEIADCDDGHVHAAPVKSYQPNAFGLYDMHGNAWEWVQDCGTTIIRVRRRMGASLGRPTALPISGYRAAAAGATNRRRPLGHPQQLPAAAQHHRFSACPDPYFFILCPFTS